MDMEKNPCFMLSHIGINSADAAEAEKTAEGLADLFGFSIRNTVVSLFASEQMEIMKFKGRGEKGHLGITVDDMDAALKYLHTKGIETIPGSEVYEDGLLKAIYLDMDIAGFAIHLYPR